MQNSKERICNYLYKCQSYYLSARKKNAATVRTCEYELKIFTLINM